MLELVDKRVFDTVWLAHKRDGGALRRLLSEARELGEDLDLVKITTETEQFCTPDRLLGEGAFNKTYKINSDIIVQKTYNKHHMSSARYQATRQIEFQGKMYNLELYNCLCDKTKMADLTEMGSGVIPILAIWDDGHEVYTIAEKCQTELMTAYMEIYNSEKLPLNGTDLEKMGIIIFQKMLRTLRCLHQNEVFHLDIKPENILLKKDVMPLLKRKKKYLKTYQKCQPLTKEELDTLTNVRLIDFGISCRYLEKDAEGEAYSCQKLIDNNKGLEGSNTRVPGSKAYRYPRLTTSKEELMLADYWSLVVSLIVFLLGMMAFNPYDDTQKLPWTSNASLFYTMIEKNLKADKSLDWNPHEKNQALNLMVCLDSTINPVERYGKKIEIVLELFQDIVCFKDLRKSTLRKLDRYLKGLKRSYSGRKLKKGLSENVHDIQKDVHIYHKIIKGTPSSLYQLAKGKSMDMVDSKDKTSKGLGKGKGKGKDSSSGEYYLARSREVLLIPATKKRKVFYSETNLNRSKKTIKKKKTV